MDKPHKNAFDHCLHCPHFSDLIDHTDLSLSDLPDKILEQGNNEFPVKKIPGEQYNLATDVVTKDFEVANKLTQPIGDLPRDDELLKEILGEDYATQSLPRKKLYEQENFTEINSGKLSNTESDKAEIDKIIEGILNEDNQGVSLDDELDIRPVNTESSDIDAFLQKYLTDDDSPEIAQNEPSEITDSDLSGIIDDSSLEITDDLTEILDDASSKIMDEESAEILDDLSELMGGESSEIIGESSRIMFDESPEIIADPSEVISDVSSEVLHIGEESNIDELIETILNEGITSENMPDETSQVNVDRTDTDIQVERTVPEAKPGVQAEHSTQRTQSQKITSMPSGYNSTSAQNVVKKTEDYKFPQAAPVSYRVPGIALFILIVAVGLVWYLVAEPAKESTRFAEVESRETAEIKNKDIYYEEVSPDLEQAVAPPDEFPETFNSYSEYSEPSLVQPEREFPVVGNTISINTTDSGLYEQESYQDKDKLTEDTSTVETENKVNEIEHEAVEAESKTNEIEYEAVETENKISQIEYEAVIFRKTDNTHIEVSDEESDPVESLSKVESTPPQQESLSVESEKIIIIDKLESDASAGTADAGDGVKKPAESTSKAEAITAEHALADNIQRNLAAAKEGDVFWALNLSSVYQKIAPVNSLLERIRSTGIPAEIKTVFINSSKWYRIRVFGFSSYAEAQGFMQEVTDKTDIEKYWISQVVVDSAYLKNLAETDN